MDPVYFAEKYLTLDGEPFRLTGNGYKPFTDIYRYIAIKALEKDGKPVVVSKGRQVGMTTAACVLELFFMCSGLFGTAGRPPMRVMHCFPQLELAYAYTKSKLNNMIATSVQVPDHTKNGKTISFVQSKLDKNMSANDSLHFKQFEGGNHVWIESTGLSADRIRGRSVDCMFFDEVQDIKGAALGNATKILAQGKYGPPGDGIQVYFGTPKQSGSDFWKIWKSSSQQYYHLGCEKCGEYFPLYTPGTNQWEEIWIEDTLDLKDPSHGYMVRCTKCSFDQDKREAAERGKWIATNPDEDCDFVGFHINQLYMPTFTRKKVISEKPENSPVNTERAYQNEVLGEFFSGSSSPITAEEIHTKCADLNRKFTSHITAGSNRKVYAGYDWGQKVDMDHVGEGSASQGQSYSSAVILTAEGPHILSIEFATLLKKNDPASKREIVEEMFRRYSVNQAVGDIGYANDLTYQLQKEHGDKFLASRAMSGMVKNHARLVSDVFPKEIQFERDYYIAQLFDHMKQGKIKFPFGDYEKIGWLVNHCCSMEIKVTMDRSGETRQRYVKGSSPNDGAMALLNAFIAYMYDVTAGFTNHNPNDHKVVNSPKMPPLAILGKLPKMR